MLAYHTRLALKSLRRNPALSTVMVLSLAIGVSVWVTARAALAGAHRNMLEHRPALHLVTVERQPQWSDVLSGPRHTDLERFARIYVSRPEADAMSRSAGPSPHSAAVDTQVVITGPDGTLHAVPTTLATRDLFALFDLRLSRVRRGATPPTPARCSRWSSATGSPASSSPASTRSAVR